MPVAISQVISVGEYVIVSSVNEVASLSDAVIDPLSIITTGLEVSTELTTTVEVI